MRKMDLLGNGDLEAVAKREGKFSWLVDAAGEWSVRQDVYFQEARLAKDGRGSLLSATSNGKSIGPELGFGHVLGTFHDEQVLLIKTAQGNRPRTVGAASRIWALRVLHEAQPVKTQAPVLAA